MFCFEGIYVPEEYRNLIDMSYHGTMALQNIKVKDEEIKLQVAKNVSTPTYAGFSIKKIECKTCGGSFDGSHQRRCPFCQNMYNMKEENWVITKIGGFDD